MFFSKSTALIFDYIVSEVLTLNEAIAAAILESKGYTDDEINGLPPIGNCSFKTGTYTGNGVDDREIDIGVDLASKTHKYAIVKAIYDKAALQRIEAAQGAYSNYFTAVNQTLTGIKAFSSTGFIVGTGAEVNTNGWSYYYIALWVD